jgi:hypothetical protein
VSVDSIVLAQQEWEEGYRRLEAAKDDPRRYATLLEQLELITGELQRRIGQTYSLAELVSAYADADRWAREIVEERAPSPGWPRDLSLVLAAAFHVYQRGALDYAA